MRRFFNTFFLILGVIFFIILISLGYIYFTDTFGIKSILSGQLSSSDAIRSSGDKNPLIPESLERTLENIGVDPAKLPSSITPEMAACFEEKLGKTRTEEIKAGDSPNATDYFKAKSCF